MPQLNSRLGTWELEHVHAWADRTLVMRTRSTVIVEPSTRVAIIGSCFAAELATMMKTLGINAAMHPSGLFYSTAAIRQEMDRLVAGGWPERAVEPQWGVNGGVVDPFRDYDTVYPDLAALEAARADADAAAAAVFADADVVVMTFGLVETWRSRATGSTFRAIPHPAVFEALDPAFHRLTVAEMLEDMERIRALVVERMGAKLVITVGPVPIHTTFTPLDVRIANAETKTRIRAAVSEFIDRHPDVHYFHAYEMIATAEKQSDYYRDDGRHIERHAVRYVVAEFLRLFADPSLHVADVDTSWLTPIEKTQKEPSRRVPAPTAPSRPAWRRAASKVKRALRGGSTG